MRTIHTAINGDRLVTHNGHVMASITTAQHDLLNEYEDLLDKMKALRIQRETIQQEEDLVASRLDEVRSRIRAALSSAPTSAPVGKIPTVDTSGGSVFQQGTRRVRADLSTRAALDELNPRVRKALNRLFAAMSRTSKKEVSAADVAETLKISTEAARMRLIHAVELGVVKRTSRGLYTRA